MGAPGKKLREYRQEKIVRLDIIARLYKRGYTYRQIREEVMNRLALKSYSLGTVHKDVNALLVEWRQTRITNIDLAVQAEIERLKEIQREAWEAWEKSKKDHDKQRQTLNGVPALSEDKEERLKTTAVQKQSENVVCCGDPRYLEIIYKCGIEIRRLLGLYEPDKLEVTGKNGKDLNPIIQVEVIDRREQVDADEENTDN